MSRIAFLGAGRMAGAIIDGLLRTGSFNPGELACLGGKGTTAPALAGRSGIRLASSLESLLQPADTLVLACKPQQLAELDPAIAKLTEGRLVFSVLAGKRLARLRSVFPNARNVVRTMPNTPGQIGAGVTGWCSIGPLDTEDRARVASLLAPLGKDLEVPEEQMDALTAVSGSGPAYVFEFAAALRDAGIAEGLSAQDARMLALETLLGAAKLLMQSGQDPEALRNQVTSPNGTTFAGLRVLEDAGFRNLICETVAAAAGRSRELSADS